VDIHLSNMCEGEVMNDDAFIAEVRARAAFATLQNKVDMFQDLTHCRVRFDNDGIHFDMPIEVKEVPVNR
jgi:hypothetical protein